MHTTTVIPNQRISLAEKERDDYRLMKETMDSIINNFYAENLHYDSNSKRYLEKDYDRKVANYMLFNNIINQEDFAKEINRYNFKIDKDHEREIKAYNKAPNKIQVLLGEELARTLKFRTLIDNEEGVQTKIVEIDQEIAKFIDGLYQQVQGIISKSVQQEGALDEEKQQEADQKIQEAVNNYISEPKLKSLKNRTFLARVERLYALFLKSLIREHYLKDKSNDGFKHSLIAGEEIYWVGVRNNRLCIENVNTIGSIYEKNENVK